MTEEPVAWLIIRTAGDDLDSTHGRIEVCGNEQLVLGRDPETCRYCWSEELSISRQHLRIHCILYEQDSESPVAPFVYATDLSANGTYLKKCDENLASSQGYGLLMGRGNTFLLDERDELHISDNIRLIYRAFRPVQKVRFTDVQEREKAVFAARYPITGRLIGEGGYGKVVVAKHRFSQRQLACKIIQLDAMYGNKPQFPHLQLPSAGDQGCKGDGGISWPPRVAACFREFQILEQTSHPNIVTLEKVFWSHRSIYILQELVTGGDLFSFLEHKGGRLETPLTAIIIRQILKGIEYLHSRDIVHRDLKPDNILLTSLQDDARIVITDFGNARFVPEAHSQYTQRADKYCRMFSYVGTLEFAAPEIHHANPTIPGDRGYSRSVDMWSIGSITGTLLSGDAMFTDRSHPEYKKNPRGVIMGLAAQCDLSILDDEDHPTWNSIGNLPKDFIKKLIVLEEEMRMTAGQALAHGWFSAQSQVKYYDDIYARAIAEWKPREKSEQLVERISKTVPQVALSDQDNNSLHLGASLKSRCEHHSLPVSDPPIATPSQPWIASRPIESTINYGLDGQRASPVLPPSSQPHPSSTNMRHCFAAQSHTYDPHELAILHTRQPMKDLGQHISQAIARDGKQTVHRETSDNRHSAEDCDSSIHVHCSHFDPKPDQLAQKVPKGQLVHVVHNDDSEPSIIYETPIRNATENLCRSQCDSQPCECWS